MMRKLIMAGVAIMTIAISSCDETTETLGYSLTSETDKFTITTDTFAVSTRSIKADSVLSKGAHSYIGRMKDPETGSYITSDYSTQFCLLENESSALFCSKDSVISLNADKEVIADSCVLTLVVSAYQGDSLESIKMTVHELAKPIEEKGTYYSNFNPIERGYVRTDANSIHQTKTFSIFDLTISDSLRNLMHSGSYYPRVKVRLNNPYTKDNKTYENYGTYIMRQYYAHPEYFKNSKTFARYICPGFYLQTTDGLGVIAEIQATQLTVYFRYTEGGTIYAGMKTFTATEEVLQTTHVENSSYFIDKLVADNSCTYLKTPAGIFTEVTLPVDDIKLNHEKDTLTSAKVTFPRINDYSSLSDIILEEPANLLMVERDSMYTFFENNRVPDNITSYFATYNTSKKTYAFNNISNLINSMYAKRHLSENWNKVVLIPVQLVTSTTNSTTTVVSVSNEMNVNSVRLVGGSENPYQPVKVSVIYNSDNSQ